MAKQEKLQIVISAKDTATRVFTKVGSSIKKLDTVATRMFQTTFKSAIRVMTSLQAQIGVLAGGAGFLALGRSIIKTGDSFERFRLTLENVLGSSTKAKAAMSWIQDFAAKTPYQLEEVTDAFIRMKNYGINPLADDALRVAGDVAAAFAATGKTITDVVEALADAQVGEFERIKEFGIKASVQGENIILRYANKHGEMTEKIIANNQEVIRSQLLAIWNEKYGGQMEKLSGTWSQMVSNLRDSWTRFLNMIADAGLLDRVKSYLKDLQDRVSNFFQSGEAAKWATIISNGFILAGQMLSNFVKLVGSAGSMIWHALADPIINFVKLWYAAIIDSDVLASLPQAFWAAVSSMPSMMLDIFEMIGLVVIRAASTIFKPLIVAIRWVWDNMVIAFEKAINKIHKGFIDLRNWIAEKLSFEGEVFGKKISFSLFEKTDYKPLFDVNGFESFADTIKKVNNEINLSNEYIADRLKQIKDNMLSNYQAMLDKIKGSGKAGELLFEMLSKSIENTGGAISDVKTVLEDMQKRGIEGVDKLLELYNKAPETFKKTANAIKDVTKALQGTKKQSSFWKDFVKSFSETKAGKFITSAYQGAKNFIAGVKENGLKSTLQSTLTGAAAGGLGGAAIGFLADQLMKNEKMQKALSKIFDAVQAILEPVAEVVAPVLEAIVPVIKAFQPVFQLIAELLKPVAALIKPIAAGVASILNFLFGIVKPIWQGIKSVAETIKNFLDAIFRAVQSIAKAPSKIFEGLKNVPIVGDAIGAVGDVVGGVFDAVGDFFGGIFHEGGLVKPVVAHDGMFIGNLKSDEVPAILQTGEYVINRRATAENRELLEAINNGKKPVSNTSISFNITINADKVDKEFVEKELIPLLEDYSKMGRLRLQGA